MLHAFSAGLSKLAKHVTQFVSASSLALALTVTVPVIGLSGCGVFSGDSVESSYPKKSGRNRNGRTNSDGGIFGGNRDEDGGLIIFGGGGSNQGTSTYEDDEESGGGLLSGLFGSSDNTGGGILGGGGGGTPKLGVNSYLWRASLDTISFMPLKSADPFGGVIITDWYADPQAPGARFKLTVYILDTSLRADGVRVTAFRQTSDGRGGWQDAEVSPRIAPSLENAILMRARELRISSGG